MVNIILFIPTANPLAVLYIRNKWAGPENIICTMMTSRVTLKGYRTALTSAAVKVNKF